MTAAVCLVVTVALVTGYLLLHRPAPANPVRAGWAPTPAVADPTDQLLAWTLRNLPGYSALATDAGTRDRLIRHGYPRAAVSVLGRSSPDAAGYLLVTPQLREAARRPASAEARSVAAVLAGAQPLAVFGDGAGWVAVSQSGIGNVGPAAQRQARLVAGRALLRNPRLSLDPAVAAAVADGRLDLRAATLLAVLAAADRVRLVGVEQETAEQRAGAPIRIVDIRMNLGEQRLASTLGTLAVDLRPAQYTVQRGGYQLVWLPDRAPSPVG